MQLRCDARLLRYLQAKHWEHRESTVLRRVKREGLSKRVMVTAGMKHEHMNTFFLYFGIHVQRPTRSTLRIPFDFKGAGGLLHCKIALLTSRKPCESSEIFWIFMHIQARFPQR